MKLFTRHGWGRTLLLTAVLVIGVVCISYSADSTKTSGFGTFTDKRDGKKYKTVVIGGRTWMAQNLNTKISDSWCYNGTESNCDKYGRLYNLEAAKNACPSGWRLPDTADLNKLMATAGGKKIAGKKLKSKTGWKNNGNGTDNFGFSALAGGLYQTDGDDCLFCNLGENGWWWVAPVEDGDDVMRYTLGIADSDGASVNDGNDPTLGFSVRCVQK
jgi:uncharacterized protein (TIGR02145 family)